MYVYVMDLANKQYLYCKMRRRGNNMDRGLCFGINGANTIFVEANVDDTVTGDTVETVTTALTFQVGWNLFG